MSKNLPGQFKIQAPFPPKGDQPGAIEQLINGARDGLAHQVLLGATGTGKSVAWDEPVTVRLGDGKVFRGPIGQLLDAQFGPSQPFETLETAPPAPWKIFAYDANPGRSDWRRITALSRHRAPAMMFALQTACGRSVEVTGDHSVWVLRAGQTQLVRGSDVRDGDCLPVPLRLPAPEKPLESLAALDFAVSTLNAWHIHFDAVQLQENLDWRGVLRELEPGHFIKAAKA